MSLALILAACGGGGAEAPAPAPDEETVITTEVAPVIEGGWKAPIWATEATTGSAPVKYWQSYRGSPDGTHTWTDSAEPYTVELLPAVAADFRSGYGYINAAGGLMAVDHHVLSDIEYALQPDGSFGGPAPMVGGPTFATQTHVFSFNAAASALEACSVAGCVQAPIAATTFPYVFAEKGGVVIAITNWGEVLFFRDGAWCRTTKTGDTYACKDVPPGMLGVPTGIQFYSAVKYRGRVLVGEYPTGRLYEFSGTDLSPSDLTPPQFADGAWRDYEAQSLAEYCGDLFAGYWPRGEVYRFDHKTGEWSLFRRLFGAYPNEPFVPHSERPIDAQAQNFYGQRVTALLPFGDSLYAVTSNKGNWRGVQADFMTEDQKNQYGAMYRIKRTGCQTVYH